MLYLSSADCVLMLGTFTQHSQRSDQIYIERLAIESLRNKINHRDRRFAVWLSPRTKMIGFSLINFSFSASSMPFSPDDIRLVDLSLHCR